MARPLKDELEFRCAGFRLSARGPLACAGALLLLLLFGAAAAVRFFVG